MESVKSLSRRQEQGLSSQQLTEKSIIIVKELEENEGCAELDKLVP